MLSMYPSAPPLPHAAVFQSAPPHATAAPAQPPLLPAHGYDLAVYNAWRQQQQQQPSLPSLPRSSRKRAHRALDASQPPFAVQDSGSVEGDPLLLSRADDRGNKRQEVQLNVPVVSASSFGTADGLPVSSQPRPLSPVLIARSPSPAGSDASMTDAAEAASLLEAEQQPEDEAAPSSPDSESADALLSPLFQSTSSISPVIPLPSPLLALYRTAASSQSSLPFAPHPAEEEQPDPSKQLILYQPVPSPRTLLPSLQKRRGREKQSIAQQQPWNGASGDDTMLDNSQ